MTHPNPPEVVTQGEGLRPCPFCGSDEGLTIGETKCTPLVHWWSVECHGCCVSITASTREEAIAAWNTRHRLRHTPDREAMARVIDPFVWEQIDIIKVAMVAEPGPFRRNHYRGEIDGLAKVSLAKADAIIAMIEGGGAHG